MGAGLTAEQLNTMDHAALVAIILAQQSQLEMQTQLLKQQAEKTDLLSQQVEYLIEQVRIASQNRFGRKSERMDVIDGQLSLFNEAEVLADPSAEEPLVEEVVGPYRRKKQKGKREADLTGFPAEPHTHEVTDEEADAYYGQGNWRRMPDETYRRLRYEPASYTVEEHTVQVLVGTGGDHQDEFLRGERPKDLIQNSIVTPSLGAAILNGKYVNSMPLYRIEQELNRSEVSLSRQTMSNWVLRFAEYFRPLWERMHAELLSLPVTQCDETPVLVVHGDPSLGEKPALSSRSYMWVHRSGEFYKDRPIILYEYQTGRNHEHPKAFYRDYKGFLVTDGLQQYHLVEKELPGITNANCWAHARRDFADACKAMGTKNQALKTSVAHRALELIGAVYAAEEPLKDLSREERHKQRQITVKPLVEAFFAWVREQLERNTVPPRGKTAEGLNYCLNQEKYLRVFLTDGDIPIDNSASERAIRTFCIGKKNWVLHNTTRGARASAIIYSVSETAKANNLKPYEYFKHLLSELPNRADEDGNIDPSGLDNLLPWSEDLPDECYKRR